MLIVNPMAFDHFAFAMTDAVVEQLAARFARTAWSPLDQSVIDQQIATGNRGARGVYLLGRDYKGEVVVSYVGQSADAMYSRLTRHARFLRDRYGLAAETLHFKALGIIIFDSLRLEERLIEIYRTRWDRRNVMSGWNGSGIGSNDTGGGRDLQKPSGFDLRFPVDITLPKGGAFTRAVWKARDLFLAIKTLAPYTLRLSPGTLVEHPDLQLKVEHAWENGSVLDALLALLKALPPTWCLQVSPVRVLLQRDVDVSEAAILNPDLWPPPEWLRGENRTVYFTSKH